MLALTYLLSGGKVSSVAPGQNPPADGSLAAAQERIRVLQDQLAEVNALHSRQLLVGSLVALIVMALVSLLLGRALAGRVLRPLRLITAATRRISAEYLDRRLAVAGPADEVKDLADTIDGLLGRLEASFAAQRRFVANASHELRTPLATMRATLDVTVAKPEPSAQAVALADRLRSQLDRVDHLLDGFLVLARAQHGALADRLRSQLDRVDHLLDGFLVLARAQHGALADRLRSQLDRVDHLLDGFLVLARAQHGALADRVPVCLADLVEEACAARAADLAAKNLTVDQDTRLGAWTQGNPALLSRMVENVIDNAVVHNQDGGWIRILTDHDGAQARLVVETGGRVLDQQQVDWLVQPFERFGADRTGSEQGSGLGLSIVAAIAAAHSGRLDLLARPQGGLGAAIALPSAPAPQEGAA